MDGIILVNKEKGWTSNDVVQKIKRISHEKTGHAGTLDPLATGVLPILVGKGTLLSKYLINHDKEYIATIKLGKKTSTGDQEGEIIEEKQVLPEMLDKSNVEENLKEFLGKNKQIPPIYSAIKINGKKMYEYARKNKKIEIDPREIEIYDIELISISKQKKEITYKVKCSKGTYIRTLSEDIAKKIGTIGYTKELQRTVVGDFKIENSVKITEFVKNEKLLAKNIISIEKFFENKPKIILNSEQLNQFINGVKIKFNVINEIYKIYDENLKFIGTAIAENGVIKRDVVLS